MADPSTIDGRAIQGERATPVVIMNTLLPGATPSSSNTPTSIQVFKGAANMANNQVATTNAASTLVAARATRRSVTIRNLDAVISVYIGVATVTVANGMLLKAGESISLDWVGLIQVIAASGTPTVAYVETFD